MKFPKNTTVLSGTPLHLAISPEREAWWAPSAQVSTWTLRGRSFEQLLVDAIQPWAKDLKRELEEPQLWPTATGAQERQRW